MLAALGALNSNNPLPESYTWRAIPACSPRFIIIIILFFFIFFFSAALCASASSAFNPYPLCQKKLESNKAAVAKSRSMLRAKIRH